MRCVARAVLGSVLTVVLLVCFAFSQFRSTFHPFDENDEETRRLLEASFPAAPTTTSTSRAPLSLSVALVLIVSLISVALLITGIIIIAVTLDPSTTDDGDESDLETDDHSTPRCESPRTQPAMYRTSFEHEYENMFTDTFTSL
ncbi:unnamed protein product [Caenorhabditis auriculariae]|uniref:Uncharacterized protein n=1 Tax=Caenorhabditis auriculariae TaxID=2777116 RepID=A0A8S1HM82_9PELO|nr:unnamed protein product [Caenorhabditis auriculariae]